MKQELINVVRTLKDSTLAKDTFLASVPYTYGLCISDNLYTDALEAQLSALVTALFGAAAEDVNWFLYEFTAGASPGPHCVDKDGTSYTYRTNEEYYEYLEYYVPC